MRRLLWLAIAVIALAGAGPRSSQAQTSTTPDGKAKVLFVCPGGNRSLIAASYFNQEAGKLGLPYRAISRGVAADSTTVPQAIVEDLRADGIDVSGSRLSAVTESDVATSQRVVTIGATLPAGLQKAAGAKIEQWDDVPPVSEGFAGSRDSIKAHVRQLIEKLDKH